MKIFSPFLLLCCLTCQSTFGQSVIINEVMASNQTTIADATGEYADWIELYNPTNSSVDLSGYYVTDKPGNPTQHQLPSGVSIGANSYLILWASNEPSRGDTHLGFKLSASGEFVGLYRPDGSTTVDAISFGSQRTDISWGRQPNGTGGWFYLTPATPGAGNGSSTAYVGVLDPPEFSQSAGFYDTGFNLSLSTPEPGSTIYYTLDGSEPDPANLSGRTYFYRNTYPGNGIPATEWSFTYQNPIAIVDRSSEPNRLSTRNSTYTNSYPTPAGNLFKGTVVRAVVAKANYLSSPIKTNTYFVTPLGSARFSLPVFSIAVSEKELFDFNTGMYTAGANFQSWKNANPGADPNPGTVANYHFRNGIWEKQGHFEMYDNLKDKWYSASVRLEMNGGWSRAFPRKTFRVTIEGSGSSSVLDEKLLPNRPYKDYESFLLRNSGQDWQQTVMRDAAVQALMVGLPFDTQGYRPGILFINGEYWGIHNLRERTHRDFIKQKYDINGDELDILERKDELVEGDKVHYQNMINFVRSNSMTTTANYSYLETQMDVKNYLDYMIAQFFAANKDWPANNIKFWRKRTTQYEPNAPHGQDGRWRWMMYDTDISFGFSSSISTNLISKAMNPAGEDYPYQEWATLLLRKILDNQQAKSYFLNRTADLLNTHFLPARTTAVVQNLKDAIAPEMPEHINRWRNPGTMSAWENLFTKTSPNPIGMFTFAQGRPNEMRNNFRNQFGLGSVRNLTLSVSAPDQGFIKVNTVDIVNTTPGVNENPYPWIGQYFQNLPITLTATAKPGFVFRRWKEDATVIGTDSVLTLSLPADRSVMAEFMPSGICESVQSGDWHMAVTWTCGHVPLATDEVVVRDGHIVTISSDDAEALTLELRDNGHLDIATSKNLKLWKLE